MCFGIEFFKSFKTEKPTPADENVHYMVSFILGVALSLAIGILFGFHFHMLANNLSTLEMALGSKNPFNLGTWGKNFE